MSGTEDIVRRLRFRDLGDYSVMLCEEAADEIERLRSERDVARRECCRHMAHGVMSAEDYAKYLNWDCFKEKK